MKYNLLHSKVSEHTWSKKILEVLGHQGLVITMDVYVAMLLQFD